MVDIISSSFGKTVKRPINHFSRSLAQTAPLVISRFLSPKSKKPTFCHRPNWQYRREKLPTRFSTIGPNKGELLFGYWCLFIHKIFLPPKKQICDNRLLCLTFFPDFGAQIGGHHIFIICLDGQTPHQSFFTNDSPNSPTGKQSIFWSQI